MVDGADIDTSVRGATFDADQSAGYPSDGQAANVSKETTRKELLTVEGIAKLDFMRQNINLFFGTVNHLEYTQQMHNFPSLFTVDDYMVKYVEEQKNK